MIAETYIRGRGPLYRLDPRPKFILLVFLVVLFLVESSLHVSAGLLFFLFTITGLSLGLKRVFSPIKSILPILVLTVLLTPPFNTEGTVIIKLGERIFLTDTGLRLTLLLVLRFSGITAAFYLFFSTTETESFILALQSFGLPFRAALTVTISLRYIPDMFSTYHRINEAHRLRTAGMKQRRGFRHRLKRLFPVLISVLINAVKNIPALAMALDSKGLGRANPRTSCRRLCRWSEIVVQLLATAAVLAAVLAAAVLL